MILISQHDDISKFTYLRWRCRWRCRCRSLTRGITGHLDHLDPRPRFTKTHSFPFVIVISNSESWGARRPAPWGPLRVFGVFGGPLGSFGVHPRGRGRSFSNNRLSDRIPRSMTVANTIDSDSCTLVPFPFSVFRFPFSFFFSFPFFFSPDTICDALFRHVTGHQPGVARNAACRGGPHTGVKLGT